MKFAMIKLLMICLFIYLVDSRSTRSNLKSMSKSKTKNKAHMKTTYWVRPLLKTATSYHSFANLAYCPGDIINQLGCPLCSDILDNSFEVYKFHKLTKQDHAFTYVVLYSTHRNEVVVTFSGPKNADPAFFGTIYSRGWRNLKSHPKIKVERTYLEAYEGKFAKHLEKTLREYQKQFKATAENQKWIFVGHSFGGSLATLAAFDLMHKKVIAAVPELDSPIVYSYGALRVGDAEFVDQVNAAFRVVRIVKSNDMYPRLPSCTWSPSINRFRCEEDYANGDTAKPTSRPELLNYIQNYYGKVAGLEPGQLSNYRPYSNPNASFLEKKIKKQANGWAYSANNPGYTINNIGDPFDEHGRTSDKGLVTYSQPLGAEVLFSNHFQRHTVCSYFYGIPNCEKGLVPEFDPKENKNYFNADLTDC